MTDNLAKLLHSVFKVYGVSIRQRTIEQAVLPHPDYPSMRCISDALDSWKVKHVVMRVSLEKLQVLAVPVIACLHKGECIWVTRITDTKVYFWKASGKETVESRDRFEEEWSGVALAIEDVTGAKEPVYRKECSKEVRDSIMKYAVTGGFIALFTIIMFISWKNDIKISLLPKILLFFVNAIGCYISYILILQEKRYLNKLSQKFCKAGVHIDCQKVTASRYSKLFGLISLAEVGMIYFTTVILWLAIAPLSLRWLSPLWWLFLIPLPFTLWSLFTQAFLIRKWCLFCCAIVFLLWVNACIIYCWVPFDYSVPVVESVLLTLLTLTCMSAVMYISKTGDSRDNYSEQREAARFKYDFRTIQSQLSETHHEINHAGMEWGNSHASHKIMLYVSIACSHCGAAVKEIRRLTEIYPDLSYRIIFAVRTDDFEHKSSVIIRHLFCLYRTMTKNAFFDMLDAWYTTLNKNLEALQKVYPASSTQDYKTEMDALYRFCRQAKINYTPAILINGQLLSQLYSYQDLYGITRALNAE